MAARERVPGDVVHLAWKAVSCGSHKPQVRSRRGVSVGSMILFYRVGFSFESEKLNPGEGDARAAPSGNFMYGWPVISGDRQVVPCNKIGKLNCWCPHTIKSHRYLSLSSSVAASSVLFFLKKKIKNKNTKQYFFKPLQNFRSCFFCAYTTLPIPHLPIKLRFSTYRISRNFETSSNHQTDLTLHR